MSEDDIVVFEELKENFKSMMSEADLNLYEQVGLLEEVKMELLAEGFDDGEEGFED